MSLDSNPDFALTCVTLSSPFICLSLSLLVCEIETMLLTGAVVKIKQDNVEKAPGRSEHPRAALQDPGTQVRPPGPWHWLPHPPQQRESPASPISCCPRIHHGSLGEAELCARHMVTCAVFTPL